MYQYHHRVRDRYGERVASLAILADASPDWRPGSHEESLLGCRLRFDFPVCKLLDLVTAARAEIARGNPSAVVIVANWAAQHTREDGAGRAGAKWELTRQLYEAGFGRRDVLELYRLVDWLLALPSDLELEFKRKVRAYEESKAMPYVTSIERMAKEEGWAAGRQEGRQEGLAKGQTDLVLRLLQRRWGTVTPEVEARVRELPFERQARLAEALLDMRSLPDLENWLASAPASED